MDQARLAELRAAGTAVTSNAAARDESQLNERLRQRDEAAFAEIVRAHAGRMLAVARRILASEEDARDAVQEAFLSAFQSIAQFREGSALSTWLHRITVNAALMRLRSSRRRDERCLEDLLPDFDDTGHRLGYTGPWRELGPAGEQERAELRAQVRKAIAELPARHRAVLVLRDIEELSTRETAELLGLTETAIKLRLHRARQALRTLLEPAMIGDVSQTRVSGTALGVSPRQ